MSKARVAAAGFGTLAAVSAIVAAVIQSALPLVILAVLVLVVLVPLAVVVLTAARTPDPVRHAHATAVLDRLILAIPGTRAVPPRLAAPPLASSSALPAPPPSSTALAHADSPAEQTRSTTPAAGPDIPERGTTGRPASRPPAGPATKPELATPDAGIP